MNDLHGLIKENLLSTLPCVLANDPGMQGLAEGIAECLQLRAEEIDSLRIYANIRNLPEDLLDILAKDFKVDWWNADYTLEEKRQTLLDSWDVHRKLGTKAAVEKAIGAVYDSVKVVEWFEYDKAEERVPYHFRLTVGSGETMMDYEKLQRALSRVRYYKNLRSAFDSFQFSTEKDMPLYIGCGLYGLEVGKMTIDASGVAEDYYCDENDEALLDGDGTLILV